MYGTSLATRSVEQPLRTAAPAPVVPSTLRKCRRSTLSGGAWSAIATPSSGGRVVMSVMTHGAVARDLALEMAADTEAHVVHIVDLVHLRHPGDVAVAGRA